MSLCVREQVTPRSCHFGALSTCSHLCAPRMNPGLPQEAGLPVYLHPNPATGSASSVAPSALEGSSSTSTGAQEQAGL